MAGISQHIPNYVKGISRQPDELKRPGEVRDAKNCIPDVTNGLMKRPGARLLNPLGFSDQGLMIPGDSDGTPGIRHDGKFFNLYVSRDESYIGQINKDGRVEIWSTRDALPRVVKYSPLAQDFSSASDGLPASSTCDSEAFIASRDNYKTIQNQINELEVRIDQAQTEVIEEEEPTELGAPAQFTKELINGELTYVVQSGYVIENPPIQNDEPDGVKINPPPRTKQNPGAIRAKKVLAVTDKVYKEWLNSTPEEIFTPIYGNVVIDTYEIEYLYEGAVDIHDFQLKAPVVEEGPPPPEQSEIDQWKAELEELEIAREQALVDFAQVAAECGSVQSPIEALVRSARNEADTNILPYFRFTAPGDIQTLSIQDRVLVVNRTVPVTMSKDVSTVRYPEGYVEIKGIAGARVYEFRVDVKNIEAGFSKMRASKLVISKAPKKGKAGEPCDFVDTKVFENITSGTGKNLVFELNTRASQQPVDNDKPEEGYRCKYTSDVILQNGGEGWRKGDQINVTMAGFDYTLEITETIQEDITEEFQISSDVTASDGSVEITVKMILEDLLAKFNADTGLSALGFEAEILGNGLYIKNQLGIQFSLVTSEWDVMNTFGNFITDITQLPTQCKAGYITKVSNSAADEDDYYLQFYGTDGKPIPTGDITPQGAIPNTDQENYPRKNFGSDGPGAWYECAKPGLPSILNHDSMPHQIRKVSGVDGVEFLVQPINWADREVGDDITNPIPRFIGDPLKPVRYEDGKIVPQGEEPRYINNALFYRNRLAFLTGEAVVLSQPIDNVAYERFNFWKSTATTLLDTDPIDILVTSKMPAVLFDAIIVNSGLLLFSPNVQFLLSTNQDILSPKTAEVNEISSYRFNETTAPMSMGTTVAFMSNAGRNGRLFEMANINRDQQPQVIEQTKIVADLIPENLDLLTHSKENGIVIAGKWLDRQMWIYRYYSDGEERKQGAWVRWELTGDLVYMSIIDDVLFIIVRNFFENKDSNGWEVVTMQRLDLKESVWTAIVEDYNFRGGDREGRYSAHLDNFRIAWPTSMQYYDHLNQTYFRLPLGYFSDKRLAAYTLKYGKYQGRAIYPKVEIDSSGTWCVLDGDWTYTRLMIGYEYEYLVELPTIYPQQSVGTITKSDISGNLIVHRINLSLGQNGVYETTLKRRGHSNDYTELYEARNEDEYLADDVALDTEIIKTVPVYDRNTNFSPNPYGIYISSNHPSPCTLISMSWEGEFTPKNYKRV